MAENKNSDEFPEIPGFKVTKSLGRGGMAQVYLGIQESMERDVAIKVMLPQLLTDPQFGDRFLREARIAAKLAHPHIVAVIDVGVAGDLYYMAMEYHPGGDLKDRIRKGLGQKESARIMKEIASALDYAHKNGFVHRDIKPDNILFSRSGGAVLSDFGIARAADGSTQLTATGSVVGTPHYMSPEQAQGKPVDGRSDLYSLGIMFYQMLVGKVPFEGESALSIGIKHIRDPIPRLPEGLAKYQTFLDKLLAKEPDERWQTGADVVRTLEVLEADSTTTGVDTLAATAISAEVQATQVTGSAVSGGAQKKSGRGVAIATVLVVAIAAGGFVAYQQGYVGNAGDRATATGSAVPAVAQDGRESEVQQKVEQLLMDAQVDYTAGRYFEPVDGNANQKYHAVLALDNSNKAAREGLHNISEIYLSKAKSAISANRFSEATRSIDLAKQAEATNSRIAVLQEELNTARKIAGNKVATRSPSPVRSTPRRDPKEEKLASRLRNANDYLSPARLSEKRLASATRLYRSAYSLAPRDRRVRRLREQIAEGYALLADEKRLEKNWDHAKRLANQGLKLVPSHRGLKVLVARIDSDQEAATQSGTRRRAFGGF